MKLEPTYVPQHITNADMLDYLNDRLADKAKSAWLDQVFAACDDARAAMGIRPPDLPLEHAADAYGALFDVLVSGSAHDQCEHIEARPLQPTALIIDEGRQWCQVCLPCARQWRLPSMFGKGGMVECPFCGERIHITTDTVRMNVLQHLQYVALVLLCDNCDRDFNKAPTRELMNTSPIA